jgi:hypothetical protein
VETKTRKIEINDNLEVEERPLRKRKGMVEDERGGQQMVQGRIDMTKSLCMHVWEMPTVKNIDLYNYYVLISII